MRHQLILSIESFPPSAHAASVSRNVLLEVRFIGGIKGRVVSSKLGLTSEGLGSASFNVTYKLAITKHRANSYNSIFRVGRHDYVTRSFVLF